MKPSAKITVTPEMINRFKCYHDVYSAWGSLHVVLDDGNFKDHNVDFCIKWAQDNNDLEGYRLGLILRQLSQTQRAKIRNMA